MAETISRNDHTSAESARYSQRAVALADFVIMRSEIREKAAKFLNRPHLPEHYRAQVRALMMLAGLKLHNIIGEGDDADALAIRDDLESLACAVVDPLVEAIGAYAAENFHGIDMSLFTDQLLGAIDGDATFNLSQVAEKIAADQHEESLERRRDRWRAPAPVRE